MIFVGDLKGRGVPSEGANKLLKNRGVKVEGVWMISEEDLEKEYAEAKRIKDRVLASPQVRQNRVEEDSQTPKRSAKESFGVGCKSSRSRKGLAGKALKVIEGGAERMDVRKVRK